MILQAAHSSVISAFTYHTARRQTSENRRGDLKPSEWFVQITELLDCELVLQIGKSNKTAIIIDTTGTFLPMFNSETYPTMYNRVKVQLHAFLSTSLNRSKQLHGSVALFIKRSSQNRLVSNRYSKVCLDKVPKRKVRGPYRNLTSIVLTVA